MSLTLFFLKTSQCDLKWKIILNYFLKGNTFKQKSTHLLENKFQKFSLLN